MGKDKTQTTSGTSTTQVDPGHLQRWQDLYDQAAGIGFTPYGGEWATSMTPDELAAGDLIRGQANGGAGRDAMLSGVDILRGAAGYNPAQVSGGAYNPALSAAINPANFGLGAGPAQAAGAAVQGNFNARASTAGAAAAAGDAGLLRGAVRDVGARTAAEGMGAYANPYEGQVVDAAVADLDRARRLALGQNADAAAAAGAFGDDRHGIADSETNRNFIDQVGQLSSGLRREGWQDALTAARADADRILAASGQNQGADLSALGLGTNLGMSNAGLLTGVSQSNASNALAAARDTAANRTSASIANAANSVASRGQNLTLAQLAQQNNQFNAGIRNQASEFGLGQALQAALANQGAGLTANAQRAAAGQGLVGAGGSIAGLDAATAQALLGFGGLQRGINDVNAAGAYQEFLREQNFGMGQVGILAQILGQTPFNSSTSATSTQTEEGNLVNDLIGIGTTIYGIGGDQGWWGQGGNQFGGSPTFTSGPGSPGWQWGGGQGPLFPPAGAGQGSIFNPFAMNTSQGSYGGAR